MTELIVEDYGTDWYEVLNVLTPGNWIVFSEPSLDVVWQQSSPRVH